MSLDDAHDVFASEPLFYEADESGPADWLMVGEVPGDVLVVPLAPSRHGDWRKARPIGVYRAPTWLRDLYLAER